MNNPMKVPHIGKPKFTSTIKISDDGRYLSFEVAHSEKLKGEFETWPLAAQVATGICNRLIHEAKDKGVPPVYEARRNAVDGSVSILDRITPGKGPQGDEQGGN